MYFIVVSCRRRPVVDLLTGTSNGVAAGSTLPERKPGLRPPGSPETSAAWARRSLRGTEEVRSAAIAAHDGDHHPRQELFQQPGAASLDDCVARGDHPGDHPPP
jgi:hypothetical protein